ncbi:MAG: cupredoxin domain-containing protein [Euryarchaeota archaeon]|nr:cupredoxin domain-containing protein [Euryarchaeota archaeon]
MRTLLVCLIALTVTVAGCADGPDESDDEPVDPDTTGGDNNTTEPQVVDIQVAAVGTYPVNPAFDPATLSVSANTTVNLTFTNNEENPAGAPHDWVLEGVEGVETEVIGTGENTTIEFAAPAPGEYAYYCSVGNHRDLGMEGTLTVG